MSPQARIWYKELFRQQNKYLPIYSYNFWSFVSNEHTTVRDWYLEFDEQLPKTLPFKTLVFG